MVRPAGRSSGSTAAAKNPFDSDDESPRYSNANSKNRAYANPFDDEHDEEPNNHRNPFDDDAMWKKNSSSSSSKKPQQQQQQLRHQQHPPEENDHTQSVPVEKHPRRRDVVKERIASITDDVASKASKVTQSGVDLVTRPRSRNLMGGGGGTQNRKLLLGDDHDQRPGGNFVSDQTKANHERIDKAMKDGYSLDGESVQELESYGLHKAEETTKTVYNALKVAEDIKEGATRTAIQLHEQGEQIRHTHDTAANIDHELSRGEKLLGSLGGLFSKTWKPKKGREITGPVISRGDSFKRKAYGMEQRNALGLNRSRASTAASSQSSGGSQFQSRVQQEFAKQDDALSDLSNVIGQLKEMSMDMGAEIGRQNEDLGHLDLDVGELGDRVKGANERTRRLLGR